MQFRKPKTHGFLNWKNVIRDTGTSGNRRSALGKPKAQIRETGKCEFRKLENADSGNGGFRKLAAVA